MTDGKTVDGFKPGKELIKENLFKLQCLFKATDIQCNACCQIDKKFILALTIRNDNLVLYMKKDTSTVPVIKRIPWFQSSHKYITTLCFEPNGLWLLSASADGSVYIIPVFKLLGEINNDKKKWNTEDITSFPSINSQLGYSRPTAIIWWEDPVTSTSVGIIGTEYGEIVFINLETGHHLNIKHVNGQIVKFHLCEQKNINSSVLLITSQTKQQWRLLLSEHNYSCIRQSDIGRSNAALGSNDNIHDSPKSFTSTRSRLQGLKQLSVEKLALLRQKLVESKSQSGTDNVRYRDTSSNSNSNLNLIDSDQTADNNLDMMHLESLTDKTFLIPQYYKQDQQLSICYHFDTEHITVHGSDLYRAPFSVHKAPNNCENILLTESFIITTDVTHQILHVLSSQLSETRINGENELNSECILNIFSFDESKEFIRGMYRVTESEKTSAVKSEQDNEKRYILPKKMQDLEIEMSPIESCIIVTNQSVYRLVLRRSLSTVFMQMVLQQNEVEKAVKLAVVFGLNAQQLLECAGDMLLSNKDFIRAVSLYKLSRCRPLKSVLKFASAGHTSELLSCLTHCLMSPAITELPVATRIHFSNLCVLAFIEMALRASTVLQSKTVYKDFLYFLSTNTFYDELLAVNIAGQTCLWEVLHHLSAQRGLHAQMLEIVTKALYSFSTINSFQIPYGLLICLSEQNLMQSMLLYSDLARNHMTFVLDNLPESQIFVLQRLVTLYDPTNPVIRPRLIRCKARQRTTSHSSQSSQCDSMDFADTGDGNDTLIEEIVETFLIILLTLLRKRPSLKQEPLLIYNAPYIIKKEQKSSQLNVDFKRRPFSAGFFHVALIRNGNVYTWGSSAQGSLGGGPTVLRFGSPQPLNFFQIMALEVLSVSCGYCHTLALTNNGVYAWGGSQYGQLGLGRILQCSSPELITSLAQEIIIDAVAGQYHSVALTADGRVFTWGWGVHGQLGHGNTEEKTTPTLVNALLGVVVRQISAGHAHTLALSVEGVVYAFGCNVVGQLGSGDNIKSSIPRKITLLPEKIVLIATAYFHNFAVDHSNRLYVWGASPQVLRMQAQAQKRSRILEQQDALDKKMENFDECEKQEGSSQNKKRTETSRRHCNGVKDTNIGILEENLTHLKPVLVDTSLVKGRIVQVSTGCHHNALLTKDGSLYTWGRNVDGQVGNGTKREVPIPTPLSYNPASIFAQVPPRSNANKQMDSEHDRSDSNTDNDAANANTRVDHLSNAASTSSEEKINPVIKAIGVCCGYDYTIAMQPGGTILAWGNNSRAQLGRIPAKDPREGDDKLVLLKSSKRVVRLPHPSHNSMDIPSQVPNIPSPVISYRSYDISSLAGSIKPLSVIEKLPSELTLHYVLEQFHGIYDSAKIMEKCLELKNYQACSKIAALQHNISDAFSYQLKALYAFSLKSPVKSLTTEKLCDVTIPQNALKSIHLVSEVGDMSNQLKKNTELFNKQVEKNIIESVEDCAFRNKMKMPVSKSLSSLQSLQQELYTFDCQGGSEELFKEPKRDDSISCATTDTPDSELDGEDPEEWIESLVFDNDSPPEGERIAISTENINVAFSTKDRINLSLDEEQNVDTNNANDTKEVSNFQKNNLTNEAIKIVRYYLNEIETETDDMKSKILQSTINFWLEHNLPIQSLENLFVENLQNIFYPLGLILFCPNGNTKYMDNNRNNEQIKTLKTIDLFSFKFCLQLCSMIMQCVDEGQSTPEYITLLSSMMADRYGPPLTGYPGSSANNTTEQMMEGIINTLSSENFNSRPFVHIKDPESVNQLLSTDEDTMVFTCGHQFPLSIYQSETIPRMEAELLTSERFVLPCTAQYLGKMLSQSRKPEIVCPSCIPSALENLVKKTDG